MPQQAQQICMELQGSLRRLHELPPLAPGAQRLLLILADEDSELEDVAHAIEQIPALTARVVGLACSAYFGGHKVRGVFDAIVRVLGLNLVRSLATAIAVGDSFDPHRCAPFNPERHWAAALLTATFARLLAEGTVTEQPIQPEDAYLCGLLHNLGLLAMVHIAPRESGQALQLVEHDSEHSLVEIETRLMGVHHRQVGAWLAFRWQLPPEVGIVMQHHCEPDYRGPSWALSLLVGVATNWAQQHLAGVATPSVDGACLEALGIDQTVLEARGARCLATAGEIGELARLLAQGK